MQGQKLAEVKDLYMIEVYFWNCLQYAIYVKKKVYDVMKILD